MTERLQVVRASSRTQLRQWLALLDRSGYVYPDKAPYFQAAQQHLPSATTKIAPPGSPTVTLLATRALQVLGTITLSRFTDHSWLIHHLAIDRSARGSMVVRVLLRRAVEFLLRERTAHTVLLHFREANAPMGGFLNRLRERVGQVSHSAVAMNRLELWRRSLSGSLPTREEAVVTLSSDPAISGYSEVATSGAPLLDCTLALGRHLPCVRRAARAYQRHGLERTRTVRQALCGSHVVAGCMVSDRVPAIVDVSGLINIPRLFLAQSLDARDAVSVIRHLMASTAPAPAIEASDGIVAVMAERPSRDLLASAGLVEWRSYTSLAFDLRPVKRSPQIFWAVLGRIVSEGAVGPAS